MLAIQDEPRDRTTRSFEERKQARPDPRLDPIIPNLQVAESGKLEGIKECAEVVSCRYLENLQIGENYGFIGLVLCGALNEYPSKDGHLESRAAVEDIETAFDCDVGFQRETRQLCPRFWVLQDVHQTSAREV